jgi:hypothetical protein
VSRKNQTLSLRLLDLVVFFLTSGITVLCAIGVYGKSTSDIRFIIQSKNENWVYPINQTASNVISGPLGDTIVEIKDGRARVKSSPCVNQSCVNSGAIHRKGQWLACLPNGIFVRVSGTQKGKVKIDSAVW